MSDLEDQVLRLARRHGEFSPGAYFFIFEALEYTLREVVKERRHVTGQELLEGLRRLAIDQFGPFTPLVFRMWGVRRTEDFGKIVFQLVEGGLMGKTERDSPEDFAGGFDFDKAFSLEATVPRIPWDKKA